MLTSKKMLIKCLNILLVIFNLLGESLSVSYHTVNVKQGSLRGATVETEFGEFIAFNGIPYAEPPIGELRFKDPQAPKPWDGIRDAVDEGGVSAQYDMLSSKFIGSDDCLYLNVATKSLSGKRAVMVLIHGGGFVVGSGSGSLYRGDYLLQHDIVYVTINYRLGMLGFLNMDMEGCSGNQGLKDQVFALKWIQENIEAFGGDKESVTIFGQSAGGASVHYLCISPLAEGLFHKAIAESGVSINPWASEHSNKEYARKIANELGSTSSNDEEIVKFLRSLSTDQIFETERKLFYRHMNKLKYLFVPTVDNKSRNPFLPQPLNKMIKNGVKVPMIIGSTSHEGICKLGDPDVEDIYKGLNENFEHSLSEDLHLNYTIDSKLCDDLKNFYFNKNAITRDQEGSFIQYEGDLYFVAGIQQILDNQLQRTTPTYLYKYAFSSDLSIMKMLVNTKIEGASHFDETTVLFFSSALPPNMRVQKGSKEYLIMQRMTKMWTDFAKTGNPTPKTDDLIKTKWSPYNSKEKTCLYINDELTAEDNYEEKSWKFWRPIYQKVFM